MLYTAQSTLTLQTMNYKLHTTNHTLYAVHQATFTTLSRPHAKHWELCTRLCTLYPLPYSPYRCWENHQLVEAKTPPGHRVRGPGPGRVEHPRMESVSPFEKACLENHSSTTQLRIYDSIYNIHTPTIGWCPKRIHLPDMWHSEMSAAHANYTPRGGQQFTNYWGVRLLTPALRVDDHSYVTARSNRYFLPCLKQNTTGKMKYGTDSSFHSPHSNMTLT